MNWNSWRPYLSAVSKRFICMMILTVFGISLSGSEYAHEAQSRHSEINEKNVVRFLDGYPDAIIEEALAGNSSVVMDLLSGWERRRDSDERYFWNLRGHKLGFIMRFHPEIILHSMKINMKDLSPDIFELVCPDSERYRPKARIYLLKERIRALEMVGDPELKDIRDEILARMYENLTLKEMGKTTGDKDLTEWETSAQAILRGQIPELFKLVPESIAMAYSNVLECPCPGNIASLLRSLTAERDEEVLSKMMRTYSYGRFETFLFQAGLDLLEEEALAGSLEAVEILLFMWRYGDSNVKDIIDSECIGPLIRVNAKLFLRALLKCWDRYILIGFPGVSTKGLPPLKEVCEYFLSKRIEALMKVQERGLMGIRNACINQINDKIEEIKHFGSRKLQGKLVIRYLGDDRGR